MQISYKVVLIVLTGMIVVAVGLAGVALAQTPMTIVLNEQNGSGETGAAMLTDLGNGMVRVDVTVSGEPAGASQPMHIHKGTCANLDSAPAFPLNNLENGTSSTEITTTMQALLASPYALNGHKSAQELPAYVFCGDIVSAEMQMTTTETATTAATTAVETPTTEATTAETATVADTATAAATETAAVTDTTVAASGAEQTTATPEASTTTTTTLPTTGTDSPANALVLVALVGIIMICLGLFVRRTGQS